MGLDAAGQEQDRTDGGHHAVGGELTAELLSTSDLHRLDASEWDALSSSAIWANPFYGRAYILAGLETIDRGVPLRALAMRDRSGALAGLFPFCTRWRPPFPWPIAEAPANIYQFGGMPLVRRDAVPAVFDAWLRRTRRGGLPTFWTFRHFDTGSEVMSLLREACTRHGLALSIAAPYQRAHLTRIPDSFEAHCETAISRNRLRGIQRNMRRLEEHGELTFERATEPALVQRRLEQFLELEHAGWKGKAGTSFLAKATHAEFARRCFGIGPDGKALSFIDSLLLDGEPIALSVNIASGGTAFTPKGAFDERWRKHSPGLVLDYLIVRQFYEDRRFSDMDSATTVDGHTLLGLWNAEKTMGRVIIGPDDWRTAALTRGWQRAIELREALKRRLRGPADPDRSD